MKVLSVIWNGIASFFIFLWTYIIVVPCKSVVSFFCWIGRLLSPEKVWIPIVFVFLIILGSLYLGFMCGKTDASNPDLKKEIPVKQPTVEEPKSISDSVPVNLPSLKQVESKDLNC